MRQVTELHDLKLSASDFKAFQKGKFSDNYELLNVLGEGAYGQVYKCKNLNTESIRAVKVMLKTGFYNEEERQRFVQEVTLLKQMDHPNILKLYEVYQDDARFYVVTELCEGGELFDEIIKRNHFSEKDAAEIMLQVLKAINYCHANDICHRDLKPENILIESEGLIKVIDFGTAQSFKPDQGMHQIIGTVFYMAPEIILSSKYNEKCDLWSLGVILYCLLTGRPPFYGDSDQEILERVKKGVYSENYLNQIGISEQGKDLIRRMLTLDPNQRISASDAIKHDWIQLKGIKSTNMEHAKESLQNLQSFSADQKMQQAVLTYIVTQIVSHDEIRNTKQIFQSLDTNNDGKLSREELIVGYRKIYGDFAEEEVEKILKSADIDGSGEIDYSEWLVATLNRKNLISDEKLRIAFAFFDKDGSGSISVDELKEILGIKKQLVDEKVWDALIKEVDQDGNGEIDYEEFKQMMTKLIDTELVNNQQYQNPNSNIQLPLQSQQTNDIQNEEKTSASMRY
eukprot:403332760